MDSNRETTTLMEGLDLKRPDSPNWRQKYQLAREVRALASLALVALNLSVGGRAFASAEDHGPAQEPVRAALTSAPPTPPEPNLGTELLQTGQNPLVQCDPLNPADSGKNCLFAMNPNEAALALRRPGLTKNQISAIAKKADPKWMAPMLSELLLRSVAAPSPREVSAVLCEMGNEGIEVLTAILRDKSKSSHIRHTIALELRKADNNPEAIRALSDVLRDQNDELVRAALIALHDIGTPATIAEPNVLRLLHSKNPHTKLEAIRTLRRIGTTASIPSLKKILKSGNINEKWEAISVLEKFKNAEAAQALIETLNEKDFSLRRAALGSLGKMGPLAAPAVIQLFSRKDCPRFEAIRALGSIGSPVAVPVLAEMLEVGDDMEQMEAIEALGSIKDAQAYSALISALGHKSRDIVMGAIFTLKKAKIVDAIPHLAKLLNKGDQELSEDAIVALVEIGDPSAVPHLGEALQGVDEELAEKTIAAMVKLGGKSTIPYLGEALQTEDRKSVQNAIIAALADIGDPSAIPYLERLPDSHSAQTALHVLDPEKYPIETIPLVAETREKFGVALRQDFDAGLVLDKQTELLNFGALAKAIENAHDFLRSLPHPYVRNIGLQAIYLKKTIGWGGFTLGNSYVFPGGNTHETTHVADHTLNQYKDKSWPKGKEAYREDCAKKFERKLKERPKGFADEYGMCNEKEDRATVAEYLFYRYNQMMDWAKDDIVLAKKIEWMKLFLYVVSDGWYDNQFWEDLAAEKTIDHNYWKERRERGDFDHFHFGDLKWPQIQRILLAGLTVSDLLPWAGFDPNDNAVKNNP